MWIWLLYLFSIFRTISFFETPTATGSDAVRADTESTNDNNTDNT